MNSVIETRAAAPPPTPLKMATSWGMAVIFTSRATGTAMTTPMTIAMTISQMCESPGRKKVAPMASAMPAAPTRVPRRACLGLERPLRARMKVIAAIR